MAEAPVADTLSFLSNQFIPIVVERINETNTRRRMALYGEDKVPENERNLSDVRNRMGLLIEYKLAWAGNNILVENGIDDLFWANVVANRFPDLEVHNLNGDRGIRVEVKCLEAIAEEKSANFDTLKKDLNPATDFVVVFLWEWFRDQGAVAWKRAPRILAAYVFHASSLAELRDYNWLNKPPNSLGDGFQGFDFRFVVNCRDGIYSEEGGNYGKLLRIWHSDATYTPGLTPLLRETINLYSVFEREVIWSGFEILAHDILRLYSSCKISDIVNSEGERMGFWSADIGIVLKKRTPKTKDLVDICEELKLVRIILMTDKYQWYDNDIQGGNFSRRGKGHKPKHLFNHLSEN